MIRKVTLKVTGAESAFEIAHTRAKALLEAGEGHGYVLCVV